MQFLGVFPGIQLAVEVEQFILGIPSRDALDENRDLQPAEQRDRMSSG